MTTAHELVERGAALLDEKLPGWADQIDLESLEMADSCHCVLGQLGAEQINLDRLGWHKSRPTLSDGYSRLTHAVEELQGLGAVDYGFDLTGGVDDLEFTALQDAWKGEIVARRTLGDAS